MTNRIIAYLLVALFALFAWLHVMIAREHAETAQAYADATDAMYAARIQSLRAHAMLNQARETYKDAVEICQPRSQKSVRTLDPGQVHRTLEIGEARRKEPQWALSSWR